MMSALFLFLTYLRQGTFHLIELLIRQIVKVDAFNLSAERGMEFFDGDGLEGRLLDEARHFE